MSTITERCTACFCKCCLVLDYKFTSKVKAEWFEDEFKKTAKASGFRIRFCETRDDPLDRKHFYGILEFAIDYPGNLALSFVLPDGKKCESIFHRFLRRWNWKSALSDKEGRTVTPTFYRHWNWGNAMEAIRERDHKVWDACSCQGT
ncbi:hypothetical protein BJY00DRAFT_314646 [Aspergillus carlsbadensis]|nr:hypothetical protein BJY00DRAFT_314646 [Aspergillus carlsbadensis]